MKCTNCGNEVPDTANVCGYCGHRLKSTPQPVAPSQVAQPAATYAPPINVRPVAAPQPQYEAVQSGQGSAASWGFPQWITGALIWGIAGIAADFLLAALSFYVFYPEMQNRWSGLGSYIRGTGLVSYWMALLWGLPGALAGGTRKTALQMLLGFAVLIPLGLLLGIISPHRDFDVAGGLRNAVLMAPIASALFIVWLGGTGAAQPGLATIFRWILLLVCGIFFGLMLFSLIASALGGFGFVFSIAGFIVGIILAVIVGLRAQRN